MMQRIIIGLTFLLLQSSIWNVDCRNPETSQPAKGRLSWQRNKRGSSSPLPTYQDVIQVIETEVWNGEAWVGAEYRWTLANGSPCESPLQLQAPPRHAFQGEWKIVTTATNTDDQTASSSSSSSNNMTRDPYGWEYLFGRPAIRRRIWLRTFVLLTPKSSAMVQKQQFAMNTLAAFRDNLNFKGFGMNVQKSLLFPKACGVNFIAPLSTNFDWWDRHPGLPSVVSGIGINYPPTLAFWVATSMNWEWIQLHAIYQLQRLHSWFVFFCDRWLQVLSIVLSTLLMPVMPRNLQEKPSLWLYKARPWSPPPARPDTSSTTFDRIGTSFAWQLSAAGGYEFRISYFHMYAPTIMSLVQNWNDNLFPSFLDLWKKKNKKQSSVQDSKLRQSLKKEAHSDKNNNNNSANSDDSDDDVIVPLTPERDAVENEDSENEDDFYATRYSWKTSPITSWLNRKTGALGVVVGCPTGDPPGFSITALLSLSGFYFVKAPAKSTITGSVKDNSRQNLISSNPRHVLTDSSVREPNEDENNFSSTLTPLLKRPSLQKAAGG